MQRAPASMRLACQVCAVAGPVPGVLAPGTGQPGDPVPRELWQARPCMLDISARTPPDLPFRVGVDGAAQVLILVTLGGGLLAHAPVDLPRAAAHQRRLPHAQAWAT